MRIDFKKDYPQMMLIWYVQYVRMNVCAVCVRVCMTLKPWTWSCYARANDPLGYEIKRNKEKNKRKQTHIFVHTYVLHLQIGKYTLLLTFVKFSSPKENHLLTICLFKFALPLFGCVCKCFFFIHFCLFLLWLGFLFFAAAWFCFLHPPVHLCVFFLIFLFV